MIKELYKLKESESKLKILFASSINEEVATVLRQLARHSENIYKSTAYTRAAHNIENLDYPITNLEDFKKIPGIGHDINEEIKEYLETGKVEKLEKFKEEKKQKGGRYSSEELFEKSREFFDEVDKERIYYAIVGSIRRKEELVKDIDLVGYMEDRDKWIEIVDRYDSYKAKGKEQLYFNINGAELNLWLVPKEEIGSATLFYTGPRSFNTFIAQKAIEKGFKINRHGLFDEKGKRIAITETEIFEKLGLKFIPPEKR